MKYKELCTELSKLCIHRDNDRCNYYKCFIIFPGLSTERYTFECNPTKCAAIWNKIKDGLVNKELYEGYDL